MGEHSDKKRGDASKVQEFSLESDAELRLEVAERDSVQLELTAGLAEVFGTELVRKKVYTLPAGAKLAVFTWQGAHVLLRGSTEMAYVARETPMVMYLNCHTVLEQQRRRAEREQARGPIALVAGPCDVGKSTLVRLLVNYAVRAGRRPLMVDLDVGQGAISVPGTIGAMMVERTASVTEGFPQTAPVVYMSGHASADVNPACLRLLVARLAETVADKLRHDVKARHSGAVINTGGWVKGEGYRSLMHAAAAFEVDVIVVLNDERLYNDLVRDMPNYVEVVFLPKSGGVAERSSVQRAEARDGRVRAYFYGTGSPMHPHSIELAFDEVSIFKVGAPKIPESALPLGMKVADCDTRLVPLLPSAGLLHHLLAVSEAQSAEDLTVTSHVLGFLCVTAVNTEKRTLTLLSPQPKPLPSNILIFSEVQYMDDN